MKENQGILFFLPFLIFTHSACVQTGSAVKAGTQAAETANNNPYLPPPNTNLFGPAQPASPANGTPAQPAQLPPINGGGRTLYVDAQISGTCSSYLPSSRTCVGGTAMAFQDLSAASAATQPGDNVLIRGGTYATTFTVSISGTASAPIVFRAYNSEVPLITGQSLSPGIILNDRQYVVIDGFKVYDVRRWLYALRVNHVTLQNNTFLHAMDPGHSSKTGIFFEDASFNKVLNNVIEDSTEDNLAFIHSNNNLIQGNQFRMAVHVLWVLKCSSNNVIRMNYFHNQIQKIGEIYDCEDVGFQNQYTILDSAKRNVVELNDFAYVAPQYDHSPFSGIQYAAQEGIIRFNRFYDNVGPAMSLSIYSSEALYDYSNRLYNNVMHHSNFAGIAACSTLTAAASGGTCYDNIAKNNATTGSVFVANDSRWDVYRDVLAGKFIQIVTGQGAGTAFFGNLIFGSTGTDELYAVTINDGSYLYGTQHGLSWLQSNQPAEFQGNIEADPKYVNAATKDFHPAAGSPLIDHGLFLTKTTGAGSGTHLPVADVLYFSNGFGIDGVLGDEIQLAGQSLRARIVSIDYTNRILTLDRALSWSANQGVNLPYNGSAPDIGAYEY